MDAPASMANPKIVALNNTIKTCAINNNNNNVPKKPPRASSSTSPKVDLLPVAGGEGIATVFKYDDAVFSDDGIGNDTETVANHQHKPLHVGNVNCVPSSSTLILDSESVPAEEESTISVVSSSSGSSTPPFVEMTERKQAVERSIVWLRQELMDMRKMDQTLIMQLMNIQMKIHALKNDSQGGTSFEARTRKQSEEYCLDYMLPDMPEEDQGHVEDNAVVDDDVDVEEENGEPVAWREFQRRLSCRRTFSKRGKMPGIVKPTAATS